MSNKLFVGGLSWNTTEDQLRELFAKFGMINEVKIITDRVSGRSKGFGFITFESVGDASNAMSEMNGKELDGRKISISEARERQERGGGDSFRGGGGGGGGGRGGDRGRGRY